MRLLSVVLLLLAVSLVSLTGCKSRGKNGVTAKRPVSKGLFRLASRDRTVEGIGISPASPSAAQCDCFTCRAKRQQAEENVSAVAIEPSDLQAEPQVIVSEEPESNTVEAPVVQSPMLIRDPMPAVREIEGELVEDSELTNELPVEPKVETIPELPAKPEVQPKPTIEGQPELISPETGFNIREVPKVVEAPKSQKAPVVPSTRLNVKSVSTELEKAPVTTLPSVNEAVFKFKTRDNSVLKQQKVAPIRRQSIWFTPAAETSPAAPPEPVEPQLQQPAIPQGVSTPVIEHEIKQSVAKDDTIVLKASPVDHHLIYNSRRPTHALVREARLATEPRFANTHQQPRNTQLQFHSLPPQLPIPVSPTPVAVPPVALPPVAPNQVTPVPVVKPQTGAQFFSPVQQAKEPAELRLRASVVPSGDHRPESALAAPIARVIPSANPVLKLNASPTLNKPAQVPAIVKIQDRTEGRVVVGSLQTPQEGTPQGTPSAVMNRLHTSPWRPMATGQNGTAHVQQSIRRLIIRPQQEANFSTDGIHR